MLLWPGVGPLFSAYPFPVASIIPSICALFASTISFPPKSIPSKASTVSVTPVFTTKLFIFVCSPEIVVSEEIIQSSPPWSVAALTELITVAYNSSDKRIENTTANTALKPVFLLICGGLAGLIMTLNQSSLN